MRKMMKILKIAALVLIPVAIVALVKYHHMNGLCCCGMCSKDKKKKEK
ncbi:hypothetical protein [Methanolapillus ohkumae]|uniref:FeoB-associated Cys-rich membrane protein n=1 Tax=Methanolapillus ohkumae TaxID=3028298 RepID=A0AA96V810_9EURY|nr:hypothetical protein MsAm2_13380 [Methanosarcinaceae archaeon Am2]